MKGIFQQILEAPITDLRIPKKEMKKALNEYGKEVPDRVKNKIIELFYD